MNTKTIAQFLYANVPGAASARLAAKDLLARRGEAGPPATFACYMNDDHMHIIRQATARASGQLR
jgi:hypothetical protein